jgi:hypothetical protein
MRLAQSLRQPPLNTTLNSCRQPSTVQFPHLSCQSRHEANYSTLLVRQPCCNNGKNPLTTEQNQKNAHKDSYATVKEASAMSPHSSSATTVYTPVVKFVQFPPAPFPPGYPLKGLHVLMGLAEHG